MIPHWQEILAPMQRQALLAAVEQHRLRKIAAGQRQDQPTMIGRMRCWLGMQLVKWGFQLQGCHLALRPRLPEYKPCNSEL